MQFLFEAIFHCNAAAGIAFTTVMAEKGLKVLPTISALFCDADPLFSRITHKVVLEELMGFTCVILEVGAA